MRKASLLALTAIVLIVAGILASMLPLLTAPYQLGATSSFIIKLPNGGQWMNVSAAPPYDIGDKFNITVGIQDVTEMTGYGISFAWNATYMNATGNYWLDSFFIGELIGGRWSSAMKEYITNDLATEVGNPSLPPLIGMFCGFGQTALSAAHNLTGSYDIVTVEFQINAYGPHGFYIWKDPSNYAPWNYTTGQPYLQKEGAFPEAWHETYSGWKNSTGDKPDYDVVWCDDPLFAPPTPLSGSVANAVLWIQPPSPYAPEAEKTEDPDPPIVNQNVTVTVTQTKAGFDGAATHDISNVTIDWDDGSPLEWAAPVAGVATFVHNYTLEGDYTIEVYCYAAGQPPGYAWYNITNPITVVPEFPAYLLMPLFLTATIIAVVAAKIVWSKKPKGRVNVR